MDDVEGVVGFVPIEGKRGQEVVVYTSAIPAVS